MISASLVKELREATGAGMLDCKKALEATNGSIDEAINWLREKGISKAAKKADRIAAEGLAATLIDGDKAVIVEVNSETDFVAKNEEFTSLVDTILKAIIDNDVETNEDVLKLNVEDGTIEDLIISKTAKIGEKLSLRRDELAKEVVDNEREVLKKQAMEEGKPANIAEKMVEGRLLKFYQESCLEEQAFVKDDSINVLTYVKNNGGTIDNMVRFEVGEGMEKREDDFASEVAKQMGA